MKVRLYHRLEYLLARTVLAVVGVLPMAVSYGMAAGLGRLFFRLARRRQRYALRMLRNAFPDWTDAQRLRTARIATGNLFKVPLDMVHLTRLLARGGEVRSVIDVSAFESLGVRAPFLALSGHLGSWEMAAVAMAALTGQAHVVARTFKNPLLQRWLLHNRRAGGLHVHPRRGGIRPLARALEQGAVGLQAIDQNQRLRGLFVPFFGEPASTERAAVTLAVRRGYPLVIGFAERIGRGFRFRLRGCAPFVPRRDGDRARCIRDAVVEVNARLEQHIRACPEQYLWIHDRYRTRPDAGAGDDANTEA